MNVHPVHFCAPRIWPLLLLVSTGAQALGGELVQTLGAEVREQFLHRTPGLAVAAAVDGKIVWSEGFGLADLDRKKPVTPRTLFRIGSISKPLTAAGLMLLVEQGKLNLDADIHRYYPGFPDKGVVITTRQLAGHLAGIRHYRGLEFLLNKHFATVRDGLKIFEEDPLESRPGEKFSYSSYGWNLISQVMEGASKEEFLGYMGKAVFKPLGMTNTMPDQAGRELPERTSFYNLKAGGGFETAPAVDNSYKWAGGGFLSTPEDLVRFGMAHLQAGFLRSESLDTLFTSQKTSDGKQTGYGVGWFVLKDKHGHRVMTHTGGSVGGTSVLVIHPDSRVVVAMTSNCTTTPFDKEHVAAITEQVTGWLSR
jgi:serine beta-lactamase-like protein LACTB